MLGVIGDDRPFATMEEAAKVVEDAVTLAIETMCPCPPAVGPPRRGRETAIGWSSCERYRC